jgi:hypothetical protein
LKASQRDALLALFQTMKCGWRQAKFSGEFSERHVTAFFAKISA